MHTASLPVNTADSADCTGDLPAASPCSQASIVQPELHAARGAQPQQGSFTCTGLQNGCRASQGWGHCSAVRQVAAWLQLTHLFASLHVQLQGPGACSLNCGSCRWLQVTGAQAFNQTAESMRMLVKQDLVPGIACIAQHAAAGMQWAVQPSRATASVMH